MNRSLTPALALILAVTAACDDDTHVAPGPADASPSTPVKHAVVVSGDFNMTGVLSKLDIESMQMTQDIAASGTVSGDPVLRQIGDRVYVVNRSGGSSVTVLDARTLAFIDQYGTGAGSNPQDVAVVGNSLYVPAMGTAGVVKIDTITLAIKVIDLSLLDSDDGKPDCISAYAVGTNVYVACGLLDEFFSARGPGLVAVIDATTDNVSTVVELPAPNPYNFIVQSPEASMFGGDLLIPTLPSFTDYSTGCVVRLSTGASPTASCADGLDNADYGGNVIHMDVAPDGSKLWMAIGTLDMNFENPTGTLVSFDLASGTLSTAVSPPGQMIQDVAACPDGKVVVADGTFGAGGLRMYKDGTEVTTAPLPIGLPPTFGNAIVCYSK